MWYSQLQDECFSIKALRSYPNKEREGYLEMILLRASDLIRLTFRTMSEKSNELTQKVFRHNVSYLK